MRTRTLFLLLFGIPELLFAQRVTPTSRFILNLDYARFHYDDKSGYLEVSFAFYPNLVSVDPLTDGTFQGWVKVGVKIWENAGGAVWVNEVNVVPIAIRDSSQRSSSYTIVSQTSYRLPFGEYSLGVVAADSLERFRSDSLTIPVTIASFEGATMLSDVQLCSRIAEGASEGPFVKNTMEVVPNPTLVFGATSHPVVFHYLELYNLVASSKYAVQTSVVDNAGSVLRTATRMRNYAVVNAVEVGTTNVTSLPSGRYSFVVKVLKDSVTEVGKSTKTFYIYNPHIQTVAASATSMKASELAGLTLDELAHEFESAKYLATDRDIAGFAKLTTADARREFLANFWSEVEQGKAGRDPMKRIDYQQRVQSANQRFRVHGREGWKSDRGRVFILFGEPDDTERIASEENAKPYETWSYFRLENGVLFVFVDRSGFGDYILVHSTKRGELQDDSWQRQLR